MALDCSVESIVEAPAVNNLDSGASFRERDENALLKAVKRGQTSAFDELWQSHAGKLLRTTYRITRNREDAEDALQGALLNAFVHLQTFNGRSSFSTWLTRIAINSALMMLRKNRSAAQISLDADDGRDGRGQTEFEALHCPGPDPELYYSQKEREAILARAIDELPPLMREALVLQKLEERSTKEAAEIMGISLSAAKARVFRAKFMLESSLRRK